MDEVISYEDIIKMLEGQPSLLPRPNCMRLRAWSKHNADILAQIPHPGYPQHGWKGMVIQPALFALINTKIFVPPSDPGNIAIYPQFALTAQIKMIDAQFKLDKNMFKTYTNIKRALYNILQKSVTLQYQTSTTPGLSSWDPSMTIHSILAQLNATYGKPDAQTTEANDAMFRMPLQQNQTPESVFLRIEDCQEVAILAENPYTDKQLINQAVLVLRKSNIFPIKDFDDWEPKAIKTWALMKAYFQEAYTKRLNAISLSQTAGQQGYTNRNSWEILGNTIGDDASTNSDGTHNTIAAATVNLPDSTLGGTTVCPVLSGAMAQLASNQAAMMTQMAALHIAPAHPPMQQIMIPQQQYTGGGRGGRGGYRGNMVMDTGANQNWIGYAPPPTGGFTAGTNQSGGRGRGRRPRRNYGTVAAANQQQMGIPPPLFGGANQIVPYGGINQTARTTVPNPVKRFANWNYCYTCGFDVAQDHTSATCPAQWRKAGHQEGCTRNNVQQYVAAGYTPSMVGKHKITFPQANM